MDETPAPVPATTPTTSCPGTYGREIHGWSPAAACVSEPHTPASTDRTSTSPEPGRGTSTRVTSIRPAETTTWRITGAGVSCAVISLFSTLIVRVPRAGEECGRSAWDAPPALAFPHVCVGSSDDVS